MISKIQQALFQYRRKKFGEFGLGYIVSQKQLLQLKSKSLADNFTDLKHSSVDPYSYTMHPYKQSSFNDGDIESSPEDQIARAHT